MKLLLAIFILFTFLGCATKMKAMEEKPAKSVSFEEVWSVVKSDPYEKLPQTEVSYFKLSNSDEDVILKDASRTLSDHADILEPFEKLAHPNGICFSGIWKIDTPNIYSGYFKNGSEALLIARASTALSNTHSGATRAFGFAGKLFATTNPNQKNTQASANFFLIDDLGGTDAQFYRDVALTNEPSVSITYEVVKNMLYAMKVSSTFSDVDKHPTIRQLYEISYLDESQKVITPKWMKIDMANTQTVDAKDFRDELKIEGNKVLIFNISVANEIINEKKEWQRIGNITLDSSVVSSSCDQRLHFHHPKFRDDLDYGILIKK